MSQQPRRRLIRKCMASTSNTAVELTNGRRRLKVEPETLENNPVEEQPQGRNGFTHESEGDEELEPLTGKSHFSVIMNKSHLHKAYSMVIPARITLELPSAKVPVLVIHRKKEWNMVYHGGQTPRRLHRTGWKTFAEDNNLKIGDACLFEIMECSSENIELKVQILRGDFPCELLKRSQGFTKENPMIVD